MLDILFITDYVCPYCLVAKEAILQALQQTGIAAKIRVQPMELTPVTKEPVDTYSDPVRRSHYTVLVEPARELGLDMKLPPHIIPRPYTKYAFEGRFFAAEAGCEDAYNDLMYKSYFLEEQDIGKLDVLCELVKRIGLDPEAYRAALESGKYEADQQACNDYSRNVLKPNGLPTVYINDNLIDIKTYRVEEMIGFLRKFDAESGVQKEDGGLTQVDDGLTQPDDGLVRIDAGNIGSCGPDGCGFGGGDDAADGLIQLDNGLVQFGGGSLGSCGPDGCGFGGDEESSDSGTHDGGFVGCGPDGC